MTTLDLQDSISLQDAADQLGLSQSKVRRLIEDQALIAFKVSGELRIPAGLIVDGTVIPALRGTLILLGDLGLTPEEAFDWLVSDNDDLGESPLSSLKKGHKAPVRRAAQLLGEIL